MGSELLMTMQWLANMSTLLLFSDFLKNIYWFLEREREKDKEMEPAAFCVPLSGNGAHNLGTSPDWEWNQQPPGPWVNAHPLSHTSWLYDFWPQI